MNINQELYRNSFKMIFKLLVTLFAFILFSYFPDLKIHPHFSQKMVESIATNIKFQAILTQKLFENVSKNDICQIQDIQIFKIKGNLKNNIYL